MTLNKPANADDYLKVRLTIWDEPRLPSVYITAEPLIEGVSIAAYSVRNYASVWLPPSS